MNGAGYTPIEFGGEDYFAKMSEILNEEIDREVRKAMKKIAQQSVTQFGLVPGGASVMGDIFGDIQAGGIKAKGRGMTGIALGAALPQFQAQFQAGETEKQRGWLAEQAELDRIFRETMLGRGYEYGMEVAGAGRKKWWEWLIETGATVIPYL